MDRIQQAMDGVLAAANRRDVVPGTLEYLGHMGVRAMSRTRVAVALAAAMVLSVSTASAQGLTVKGDARAWSEIEAALIKLYKLKAYRMKVTSADGGSMTMAIVPPDRTHTTVTSQGGTFETIRVGNETRVRQGSGPWSCLPPGATIPQMGAGPQQTEPAKMTGEVTASRGPQVAIAGVQTQSYMYSHTLGGSTSNFRIFIGIPNGLPRRLQTLDARGAVTATIDYFDYDAPITIALPACG